MKFGDAKIVPLASTESRFIDSPETRDALARQRIQQRGNDFSDLVGAGYAHDYAGEGTSEAQWDLLMSMARLLQVPDLFSSEWLNSGGYYDRAKAQWFNRDGADGIPIDTLRGVVCARIVELRLDGEAVYGYVTRRGRTIQEEEHFLRLPFEQRIEGLRTGAVQ